MVRRFTLACFGYRIANLLNQASMSIPPTLKKLRNKRLLVVDDSKDICFLWRRILEKHGAEVHTAESADQALIDLKSYEPDLIVSDLSMPDHDGFELIKRLKHLNLKRLNGNKVPVLAVSGHDDPALREKSMKAGFSGYVLKPVSSSELVDSVAGLLADDEIRTVPLV